METFTDQDLIAELQQYHPPIENRTGGFTQREWAEAQNLSISVANIKVKEMLKEGVIIEKRQRCEDGHIRFVYYKCNSSNKD